jgi:hypothetical protein
MSMRPAITATKRATGRCPAGIFRNSSSSPHSIRAFAFHKTYRFPATNVAANRVPIDCPCKYCRIGLPNQDADWSIVHQGPQMGTSRSFTSLIVYFALLTSLAGCATESSNVMKTFDDPTYTDHSYNDILVIGVAGDYNSRAEFERTMVSRIKAEGGTATAFYTVVGRNQPITPETVRTVVRARDFSAVLLTRVLGQESDVSIQGGPEGTKASRRQDRAIDLFRYNYETLTNPSVINVRSTVTLSAEMFSSADERRMWAIESTIADKENVGQIIEAAADTILGQLKKDNLIGD